MKNYIVFALIGALILVVVLVVVLVVLPKSSSSSLTSAPTTSAPTTSAALVKTVSLEKPMGGPDYHMNLAEIELYDAQNNKIPVSNLTASLSPPYTTSAWGAASNLLDGDYTNFAHTDAQGSATLQYMRIVLTNPSSLSRIFITNRPVAQERINRVSVRTIDINNLELSKTVLSNSGNTYTLTYDPISGSNTGVTNTPTALVLVKTVSLEKPMGGGDDGGMNIAEIELYDAQNIKIPVSNLTASLNPVYDTASNYAASNLLDGSPDTFAATNQVDTSATLQYMRVVLTNPSSIGRVVVTSRTYCCKARINGVSVRTMDINNAELSKTVLSGSGGTYSLTYNPISGSNIGVINTPALTNAP